MDEYSRNENQEDRIDDSNVQNDPRVPEYSFWAEQMTNDSTYVQNGFGDSNLQASSTMSSSGYGGNATRISDPGQFESVKKTPTKGWRVFAFVLKALVFGILAGATFIGSLSLYHRYNPETSVSEKYVLGGKDSNLNQSRLKVGSTENGTIRTTTRSAVIDMVEDTMAAIVSISSVSTQTDTWFGQEYNSEGSGSGIIVGKNEKELLIATNNHVVEGANKISVTFIDGSDMEAVIKGTDAMADLAVISVDISGMEKKTLNDIKVAKLGDSNNVKVGQMSIAIGNAMGYGQSVTVGYVSAKDRQVEVSDNYTYKTMVLLQTDAAINPGNSGGALLNLEGEVIGINTVKYASHDVEGMGYAIPISRAIPIINDLMNREILEANEQGFLGVGTRDVTEEVSQMYNIPLGVFLAEVRPDSAADKAELKIGDIVTKINETEITSQVQLSELISSIRTGTEIEVTFMRGMDSGYKEMKVKAVLGTRPVE